MKTFYSLSWTAYCLAVCCYLLVASIIGQSSIVAQTSTSCMGDFMPYATVARSNGEMFRQFADINMDGLTDIITQESGAFARFYVNTGSSFQPAGTLQLPPFGNVVAAKDFDNDGWVDLLSNSITGQTCQSNQIRIFWNTGTDGSFYDATLSTNLPLPANPYCMQSQDIDFDGDGWMDVIATSMPFSPSTNSPGRTYKNNGSRNFSIAADFLWPRDLYGTHVRDFNGDGNADFIADNIEPSAPKTLYDVFTIDCQVESGTGAFCISNSVRSILALSKSASSLYFLKSSIILVACLDLVCCSTRDSNAFSSSSYACKSSFARIIFV